MRYADPAARHRRRVAGRYDPAASRRDLRRTLHPAREAGVDRLDHHPIGCGRLRRCRPRASVSCRRANRSEHVVARSAAARWARGARSRPCRCIRTAAGAHHYLLKFLEIDGAAAPRLRDADRARRRHHRGRRRTTSCSIASTRTGTPTRGRSAAITLTACAPTSSTAIFRTSRP